MTQESHPDKPRRAPRETGMVGLVIKVLLLGTAVGLAVAITPALVELRSWTILVMVWGATAALLVVYGTGRLVPGKYLLPGVLMLTLFVITPILLTAQLSTTNYGDGTRTSKEQTVAQIVASSVQQTPDAPRYNLSVGTDASPTQGPFTLFLVSQEDGEAYAGTIDGLEPLDEGSATIENDKVTAADGYTILDGQQINTAFKEIEKVAVPTGDGAAIRPLGISQAFEGKTTLVYDEDADTITNVDSGTVYRPEFDGDKEFFVDDAGNRVSDQSWTANVGLDNYARALTDPTISKDFFRIFLWTVAFATLSVLTTFALGLFLAVTLNDPRVKGQKVYRALLIIPYAIPGFISLLIWAGFFNRDFGLINEMTGLSINWFGQTWSARLAVILTNLWMGFPYMFLVCTGALQAISGDLKEAARIDGASGWQGFRRITLPLLLVTVGPLLVASFAFNFNNFNAIYLLTKGGPFAPDNPTAGGTDILISYTFRLAFGGSGVQIGFASAISVLLFIITGVIAALQFRATRGLEEVN